MSAICRRNAVEDATIPRYTALISREDPLLFYCACDGGTRPKAIDPCGYHLVGCRVGANAIRLHDEVVVMVAELFRTLSLYAIVEPMHLFADVAEGPGNQRPDVFIRNPRGLGRQAIIDVAVLLSQELMVNLEQATRQLIDFFRLVMIRKWLNMVALRSEIVCDLSPQLSLTLVKLIASLKLSLGSK